jgi:DNA-binding MarR family transcriptional regulator
MHMHTFVHGCSCFAVRRLARRITRFYDRHLAAEGLRTTQYSLLSHLRGRDGVAMRELAVRLGMDRSTLNRNVRPLIEAGWIAARAAEDPRAIVLALTDAGRRKQAAARARWAHAQAAFEQAIGPAALDRLHADVDTALQALPDDA